MSIIKNRKWLYDGVSELTQENLYRLFNNELPYIRLKGFFSTQECDQCIKVAESFTFGEYDNVEPVIERIGCTVFEYERSKPDGYFAKSRQEIDVRDTIFFNSINPLEKLIKMVAKVSEQTTSIAKNASGETYYAGLIRKIEKGTELHIDYSPAEQKGWEVCDVLNQLAWNLYLQLGAPCTGETIIYDRVWELDDEQYRYGSYGFEEAVVDGCNYVKLVPEKGELILFNTRNYHKVLPSEGKRMTVASAIGELPNGNILFWS
ncbi:hypothetical protein AN214_04284 [Pseudoalteromonas sp. P1-9]|uniref:2OG-Fe(II)-dependent halogenase WelO5 family protein n=1 Tax=Pseudoalteromonas sp. P1-9 TaxID=1710354 RepID=UPI0006D64512|nr:hypothetical protein [Pseudoalteromonas sp. P1-9]KPV93680.1 hypothetical protein AN214_04284 [Pseudoalteromonas sp. P1-9]